MLCSLVVAAIWQILSSYLSFNTSSTHSISKYDFSHFADVLKLFEHSQTMIYPLLLCSWMHHWLFAHLCRRWWRSVAGPGPRILPSLQGPCAYHRLLVLQPHLLRDIICSNLLHPQIFHPSPYLGVQGICLGPAANGIRCLPALHLLRIYQGRFAYTLPFTLPAMTP